MKLDLIIKGTISLNKDGRDLGIAFHNIIQTNQTNYKLPVVLKFKWCFLKQACVFKGDSETCVNFILCMYIKMVYF